MTTTDLTLLPLYRLNKQELPAMPGLLAMTPPRKTARGREKDRLIVYLVLTGNATLSTAEYLQLTSQTASKFFETPGALTSAMRAAADELNHILIDRNMDSTGRGQYVVGLLVLAALRGSNCTMLQSGPTHVFTLSNDSLKHAHDPSLSGQGLGVGQSVTPYFTQTELNPGDRLIFSAKPPDGWDQALGQELRSSIEAIRRKLFTVSQENINAVLIHAQEGNGKLTVMRPVPSVGREAPKNDVPVGQPSAPPTLAESLPSSQEPEYMPSAPPAKPESISPPVSDDFLADEEGVEEEVTPETPIPPIPTSIIEDEEISSPFVEESEPEGPAFTPSAYGIPPQIEETLLEIDKIVPEFPASIPGGTIPEPEAPPLREMDEPIMDEEPEPEESREPSEVTRQMARGLIGGLQATRRMGDAFTRNLSKFLPNLLPGSEGGSVSVSILLFFIAIVIPLLVVTAGVTAYLRFGRSYQYDNYYLQAESARVQAENATDPARQRDGWQAVLFYLDQAEFYRSTPESESLREEAQANLDELLGIQRLNFYPAFSSGLNAQISRLAANETDLYMLDAQSGRVLHASQVGRVFEMDEAFRCGPGQYGDYNVGPIVDILILPRLNTLNASVLGIDAGGTLLYCSPGEVGQAIPLAVPDTNWGRVTGFTLDGGSLYVLDATSRALWVYDGQESSFIERPYFFFGSQIPDIEDSIDLVVNADKLFLLHADGHLSSCSYSRLNTVPTRCEDPVMVTNTIPAYQDIELFEQVHLTRMMLTSPPDSSLLFLDAENRNILRVSLRTLELQDQIYPMPGNTPKPGPAGAMTLNPNRVLFLAVDDQVYFATAMP